MSNLAKRNKRGFTLIEILAVLLIAGLCVPLAFVSTNQDGRIYRWDHAVDRFADVLSLAVDETEYAGQSWRVKLDQDSGDAVAYRWQQWIDGEWQDFTGDDWAEQIFSDRSLPQDLELALELNTSGALPGKAGSEAIYFLASGELTPFVITVTDKTGQNYLRTIRGELPGRISVQTGNQGW